MFGRRKREAARERARADAWDAQITAQSDHLITVLTHFGEVLAILRRDLQEVRGHTGAMAGVLGTLEHRTAGTAQQVTELATACKFVEVLGPRTGKARIGAELGDHVEPDGSRHCSYCYAPVEVCNETGCGQRQPKGWRTGIRVNEVEFP